MPRRQETVERVALLLEDSLSSHGLAADGVWLGIYQVLLWVAHTEHSGSLPHIISADNFRRGPSERGGAPWVERALLVRDYLCKQLGCSPEGLEARIDLLMRLPEYAGLQRHNPLGIAFSEAVAWTLRRFGDPVLRFARKSRPEKCSLAYTCSPEVGNRVSTLWLSERIWLLQSYPLSGVFGTTGLPT
mgnify:CR=1 FL=1